MANAPHLNIGQAAAQSGVSAKMIRHYESIGLLPKIHRTESGYRQYGASEIHTLRFIRRARSLGFGMEEIGSLVQLWQDRTRASKEVKHIAMMRIKDLRRKIEEMQAMEHALRNLVHACQGDERPECPILDDLAS